MGVGNHINLHQINCKSVFEKMSQNSEKSLDMCEKDGLAPDFKISPQDLMQALRGLNIEYELFEHEAVFTVEESHKVASTVKGAHCRNLALVNKKKQMWLVTLRDQTPIDLKKLESVLGSGRLSFMRPERLWDYLGVRAGSVTPFAIMNDAEQKVISVLEEEMLQSDLMNVHPMINTMSVALAPADLLKFISHTGHEPLKFTAASVAPEA
jgi:Ala-tRNA(Pro) deacylase